MVLYLKGADDRDARKALRQFLAGTVDREPPRVLAFRRAHVRTLLREDRLPASEVRLALEFFWDLTCQGKYCGDKLVQEARAIAERLADVA